MGRPKKIEEDKKIKISISVDRKLYHRIKKDKLYPSRVFDELLKEYYGSKNL